MHNNSEDLIQRVLTQIASASVSIDRNIEQILGVMREHLQMDVAFVSEFGSRDRVFRHVINPTGRVVLSRGDSMPMEAGYCPRVVDGRLPSLIPDTSRLPEAMGLPETMSVPIGSHISVPIRLSDGSVYGTFCCFSFEAKPGLDERDLHVMRALAQLVSLQVQGDIDAVRLHNEKLRRISSVLEMGQPRAVYQPIYRLHDRALIGVECLSRFDMEPKRSPDVWFNEANEIGLGMRLEINAMLTALQGLRGMPGDFYVSVNISPQTLVTQNILGHLDVIDAGRLVLELTEHALVEDYPALQTTIKHLRAAGVRFAVDDAGAGYSSMRHILTLHPEIIKMDISLTRDIDHDRARQAMAAALVGFGRQTGSHVTAEGIETREELEALQSLGVGQGQGYYLSHPLKHDDLRALLQPDAVLG